MANENQKSYQDMNAQELRAGINAVLKGDSAPLNPEGSTATPDELRAQFILAKKAGDITASERQFLAQGIAEFERTRNL